ncbi:hypothetical protein GPALN_005202 [Globodera pallida]|nr:hypothetical protein GPALN_005202 [Globodera pallida]
MAKIMFFVCAIFLLFFSFLSVNAKKKCFKRVHGSRTFVPEVENSDDGNLLTEEAQQQQQQQMKVDNAGGDVGTTFRMAKQDVYLWPTLSDREKLIIRDAFRQIHRRSCISFNELNYKPWYHHERWSEGKPYVVIRKSKKFFGYSDNKIEDVNRRSLIYLSEKSLGPQNAGNTSRGMVMEQLLKFMGYREEFLRPDAPSYLKPTPGNTRPPPPTEQPKFSNEQLMWPFDPESITMPAIAGEWFKLTIYCQARHDSDIGAGQRSGILTRWDAIKLNTMYCPQKVGYADPRMGPCVVPRKKVCKEDGAQLSNYAGNNAISKRDISGGCTNLSKLQQNAKSKKDKIKDIETKKVDKTASTGNEFVNVNGNEEETEVEEANNNGTADEIINNFFDS